MTAHRAYAGVGVVAVAAYFALPEGIPRAVAYFVIGMSCVAAMLAGVWRHRPARGASWVWLAAGLACWAVADGLYAWLEQVLGVVPFPSAADVYYLTGYLLMTAGLVVMVRLRHTVRDKGGLVDAAILTVALSLVTWVVLAGPIARSHEDLLTRTVGVAYPVADILLLALLVRLVTVPGARTASFRLFTLAVVLILVGDNAFAVVTQTGTFDTGWLEAFWLFAYVAWGTAALHPTMTSLTEPSKQAHPPFSRRRLAALTGAVLVAPLTPVVQRIFGRPPDTWAVVVASTALFVLVVTRMNAAITDVTAFTRQRDALADDLAHQSAHDPLTQVTSRARVLELIEAALHRAQRSGTMVGLLTVDLYDFKSVNDAFGAPAGDEVLREAAARIQAIVRAGDTVGRIGGDEFVVLVEPLDSEADVLAVAERAALVLSVPVLVGDADIPTGATVGVAVSQDGGTDAVALLRDADAAAQRAKAAGRGHVEVFDDALRFELRERADLEAALRQALAGDELSLCYQSVVSVETGAVEGYEALVRWDRPGHGPVRPDAFIPTAELSGLICDLDVWVLRRATRQLAEWTAADPAAFAGLTVAVNISGRHVADDAVVGDVDEALKAAGLPPERLVVEITETVLVDDATTSDHLRRLRELGVGMSIDDFGTGYTSIGQLHHLPADTLKIDKSLVDSTAPGGAELVRLVISAAHAFGLKVVAEGVEEAEQLAALRRDGCDQAQGYLFARPRPAEQITGRVRVDARAGESENHGGSEPAGR